ncbi:hypothetical protein FOZ63_003738 [Perkinsus olseni]|uniref:Uncharacterized protein n=1 Tax=Perkinsus olseni TaxID=32597 RepID=A0A7J6STH2_PEROL|nr:hypothetical protein FOZ63_003738 [Perkinsus olseni]
MITSESPLEIAAQIDALTASIEALQEESELVGIEAELLAGYLHRKGAKEEKAEGVGSDSSVQGKRLIGRGRGGKLPTLSSLGNSRAEKYDIAQEEVAGGEWCIDIESVDSTPRRRRSLSPPSWAQSALCAAYLLSWRVTMRGIQGEVAQANRQSDHNMDILKALMEETDISAAEVKRDAFEFRRDIVVGAENPR